MLKSYSFKAKALKFCIEINIASISIDYLVNQPSFLAIFKMAPVQIQKPVGGIHCLYNLIKEGFRKTSRQNWKKQNNIINLLTYRYQKINI